jgi:hypothetical protein
MMTFKKIAISLAVALAVWAFFSWPVPRVLTGGIACASLNIEKGGARAMMPGDHLQFLYQFWLTAETLKGHAPLFVNPYEFNIGNDADGAFRGTYYVPFSLFYTLGSILGGPAFGYNFNQWVSVWLALMFLWLLVRRYCADDGLAGVASLIGLGIPYAWITMFDGSPTGLAMMWIPLIYWALDVMVAERKSWAGAVAGLALCLAESDTHVFFFALLSSPVWCVLSYLFHYSGRRPGGDEIRSLLKAGIILVIFLGVAVWQVMVIRHSVQETTLAVSSRSIEEIRAGSPPLAGLVKFTNPGEGRKIYVGGYLVALLGMGAFALLRARRRGEAPGRIPLVPLLLLGAVIAGVVLLSTGVMNPLGPRAWKVVMKLIPPYAMIRQPHKIFCLMPTLLALASGLLLPYLLRGVSRRWRTGLGLALVVPMLLDYGFRIRPTICMLDREQGAFQAIALDAEASGNARPHLLSLPIWPGDSHYDSLNEYYISLYGLRMVNGYGGSVRRSYLESVFQPLESMNVGAISEDQLDFLLNRGVGYLVLHEDCFPEKVSPFPVGLTLQALSNHSRLKGIGKDAAMWAFKILPADQAETNRPAVDFMKVFFPARRFEFEQLVESFPSHPRGGQLPDHATLSARGQNAFLSPSLVGMSRPLGWSLRARGHGRLRVSNILNGVTNAPLSVEVSSDDWIWSKTDVPAGSTAGSVGALVAWEGGSVDLDMALLMAGDWRSPQPGQRIELPASNFFHAGYTDPAGESVTLRAAYEPDSIVFYGPKLPLEAGRYSLELVFDSPAPSGTVLGRFNLRWSGQEEGGWVLAVKGKRAVAVFEQKTNLPFFLAFEFLRAADIRIRSVGLTRLE